MLELCGAMVLSLMHQSKAQPAPALTPAAVEAKDDLPF